MNSKIQTIFLVMSQFKVQEKIMNFKLIKIKIILINRIKLLTTIIKFNQNRI